MTRVEDSLGILERLSFPNTATEAYIPCSLDTLIYAPGKHAFKSPGHSQKKSPTMGRVTRYPSQMQNFLVHLALFGRQKVTSQCSGSKQSMFGARRTCENTVYAPANQSR